MARDRIPYLDRLRSGLPLPVDASGYLNLIHVDDAVRAIVASEQAPVPDLFVVADGAPVRRADYYQEVARRLGCVPTFTAPDPDSPQAQRALASKRIRNCKLIDELASATGLSQLSRGRRGDPGGCDHATLSWPAQTAVTGRAAAPAG